MRPFGRGPGSTRDLIEREVDVSNGVLTETRHRRVLDDADDSAPILAGPDAAAKRVAARPYRSAAARLTMATGVDSAVSTVEKSRPLTIRVPAARKYSGST